MKKVVPPNEIIDTQKEKILREKIKQMKDGVLYCYKCGYIWIKRSEKKPDRCANCNNKNFDVVKPNWKVLGINELNEDSEFYVSSNIMDQNDPQRKLFIQIKRKNPELVKHFKKSHGKDPYCLRYNLEEIYQYFRQKK